MDCGNKIADVFYAAGGRVNVIVLVLLQPAEPLHSFDCLCLKLKLVSCALACCIGTTTTADDSIATAASTATITNVELFICLLLGTCTYSIFTLRKIILNFPYRFKYDNDIKT